MKLPRYDSVVWPSIDLVAFVVLLFVLSYIMTP